MLNSSEMSFKLLVIPCALVFLTIAYNNANVAASHGENIQNNEEPHRGIRLSRAIRRMTINIPKAVRVGHSVTLECDYDLEGASLYSVKWYRDHYEFYRYVPKEAPATMVFPLPGLHVDVSLSDAHKVTLLSIGEPMAATFQCEVSEDAPTFHTDMRSAHMTIAVVPDGVPVITVDKSSLEQGGPLISECSAPASFPALNLTWYVNDQKVPGSTSYWTKKDGNLEKSFSRLELTGVGGSWGAIRLRCEANLFRLFRANSLEVSVKPDVPQPASVLLMGSSQKIGNNSNPPEVKQSGQECYNIYVIVRNETNNNNNTSP